jgi:hypothetical protein
MYKIKASIGINIGDGKSLEYVEVLKVKQDEDPEEVVGEWAHSIMDLYYERIEG